MELGTDEAYYWLYSQDIKWNYFDHPPMVAIWIRFFTANLALQETEGFIRLGSVAGCAVASWAIYKTAAILHTTKAGLFGVCLYNSSLFASVTAGIFIMPDTPQMVFYTLSLWIAARIIKDEKSLFNWVLFGITAGLCIMSKVYGILLWAGLGLYALTVKKSWLSQPYIYIAFLITALITSPILIWNMQHNFLTYRFHSSRLSVSEGGFDLTNFGREVLNQFLYNNPFNVVVTVIALIAFFKTRKWTETGTNALTLFNFIGLPLALLLLTVSFFRDTTLPHWSGPAYVALIPLAAIYLARQTPLYAKRYLVSSLGSFVIFLIVWQYLIHFAPETVGARDDDNKRFRAGKEIAKRLLSGFESFQLIAETKESWQPADDAFETLYKQETSSGKMEKGAPVICFKWWGAHIEYYFCHPNNISMIGLGDTEELHEYLFLNAERKDTVNLNTAYCIVPADDYYNVTAKYSPYYQQIEKPSLITVSRKGKPDVKFFVYRLRGWRNKLPQVERDKHAAIVKDSFHQQFF